MSELIDTTVDVCVRFATPELVIAPELIGLKHEFIVDACAVSVCLPSASDDERNGGNRLRLIRWINQNGAPTPLEFYVTSVDVRVSVDSTVLVPKNVLTSNPNAYDYVSGKQQEHFNGIAVRHESVAEHAFDEWVRVLRWKTNNGRIARKVVRGPRTGLSAGLENRSTGHRFWSADVPFKFPHIPVLTVRQWDEIAQAMKSGARPRVHIDLLFDASEHLRNDDRQRCVIDAAMACEAYMRHRVTAALPLAIAPSMARYIDEANIRTVITRFLPDVLNGEGRKLLKEVESSVHQLFNSRNTIVHSGEATGVTESDCEKYLKTVELIVSLP
jgi:hypothetical protein